MTKAIAMTNGMLVLVDDEDYEKLAGRVWSHVTNGFNSYAGTKWDGRTILMHRAILNAPKGIEVDHINGDGLDNRRSNLRLATSAQNKANRRKRDHKRYKGTIRYHDARCHTQKKVWVARICANGKHISLGYYETEEEAARAYDAAALKHFGEYAQLNFPSNRLGASTGDQCR